MFELNNLDSDKLAQLLFLIKNLDSGNQLCFVVGELKHIDSEECVLFPFGIPHISILTCVVCFCMTNRCDGGINT